MVSRALVDRQVHVTPPFPSSTQNALTWANVFQVIVSLRRVTSRRHRGGAWCIMGGQGPNRETGAPTMFGNSAASTKQPDPMDPTTRPGGLSVRATAY